jgi:hypothetical protein
VIEYGYCDAFGWTQARNARERGRIFQDFDEQRVDLPGVR